MGSSAMSERAAFKKQGYLCRSFKFVRYTLMIDLNLAINTAQGRAVITGTSSVFGYNCHK